MMGTETEERRTSSIHVDSAGVQDALAICSNAFIPSLVALPQLLNSQPSGHSCVPGPRYVEWELIFGPRDGRLGRPGCCAS